MFRHKHKHPAFKALRDTVAFVVLCVALQAMLPARTAQKPLRLSAPYGQRSLFSVPVVVPCWFTGPVPPCRCGCPPFSVLWAWPCR